MSRPTRELTLTPAHIARVHRIVQDSGIPTGLELNTDADYAGWVDRMIQTNPAPSHPTRLFAYGSLIWKPELEHSGEEFGAAKGMASSLLLSNAALPRHSAGAAS